MAAELKLKFRKKETSYQLIFANEISYCDDKHNFYLAKVIREFQYIWFDQIQVYLI